MRTGCSPPYKHGTGGYCGCVCGCCLPYSCTQSKKASVYFHCGSAFSPSAAPHGCNFHSASCSSLSSLSMTLVEPSTSGLDLVTPSIDPLNIELEVPVPQIPDFTFKPILSEDGRFSLGSGSVPCSVPCATVCVTVSCGGVTPCCCVEAVDSRIYAVGNGTVVAPTSITVPGCGTGTVLINGQTSPVFVNDGQIIHVTIIPSDSCCCCEQISSTFGSCPITIWKRKIDPRSGKTTLYVNKKLLIERIKERRRLTRNRK